MRKAGQCSGSRGIKGILHFVNREPELGGGQSLDDAHLPMTVRAMSHLRFIRYGRGIRFLIEQGSAQRKQFAPSPVGEPAEIADARQTLRQSVPQETAQELLTGKSLGALLVVMSVILPVEGHMRLTDRDNPMVGYGDAMGIAALRHGRGAPEGLIQRCGSGVECCRSRRPDVSVDISSIISS